MEYDALPNKHPSIRFKRSLYRVTIIGDVQMGNGAKMSHIFLVKQCTKMNFSFKDFFSQCNFFSKFRQIWSHLLKKSLMEHLCSEIFI